MVMTQMIVQADAERLPLDDQSVDVTIGSPPYADARTYGIGAQRSCVEWVMWMLRITQEAQRVTRGPVIWIAAGVTRDRNYWPICEGLMWEWWKLGGEAQLYRPAFWHRVGIPGSGGKDWLRADVEYCMCFKRPGKLAWSDNTACGHPPKWAPGGSMSNRLSNGARVNQWGHPIDSGGTNGSIDDVTCGKSLPSHFMVGPNRRANGEYKLSTRQKVQTRRKPNGERPRDGVYNMPTLANPGTLIKVITGGGVMGHKLAHENEAPYPVKLAEFFVKSFCPPGGIVLDCFGGSGTTAHAATVNGRGFISSDIRFNQCELMRRRLATIDDAPKKTKRERVARPATERNLFTDCATDAA